MKNLKTKTQQAGTIFLLILGRSDLRGILPHYFSNSYLRNICKINPLKDNPRLLYIKKGQ